MKISNKGIEFIHQFEQLRLKAYKPFKSEKYFTIGWGHYSSDVKENMIITKEQAEELWLKDAATAEYEVNRAIRLYNLELNQNQFDALVSFVFNIGSDNFRNSSVLKDLRNRKDKETVSQKFLYFCKRRTESGALVFCQVLYERRKKEVELFLS